MGERRFRDLPENAVAWVKATVLGASLTSAVACGGPTVEDQAPTCGPCCHGGGPDCEMMQTTGDEDVVVETVDEGDGTGDETQDSDDRDDRVDPMLLEDDAHEHPPDAPTCGPCCHGTGGPECDPPMTGTMPADP